MQCSTFRPAHARTDGFSLIEFLIVISIIVIILGLNLDGMSEYAARQSFSATVADVRDGTISARQKTLGSVGDTTYGVHASTTAITFFEGTYTAGASSNEVIDLPDYISVSYALSGGTDTASFARLSGMPSATGTIVLSDLRTGQNATITINDAGLVE